MILTLLLFFLRYTVIIRTILFSLRNYCISNNFINDQFFIIIFNSYWIISYLFLEWLIINNFLWLNCNIFNGFYFFNLFLLFLLFSLILNTLNFGLSYWDRIFIKNFYLNPDRNRFSLLLFDCTRLIICWYLFLLLYFDWALNFLNNRCLYLTFIFYSYFIIACIILSFFLFLSLLRVFIFFFLFYFIIFKLRLWFLLFIFILIFYFLLFLFNIWFICIVDLIFITLNFLWMILRCFSYMFFVFINMSFNFLNTSCINQLLFSTINFTAEFFHFCFWYFNILFSLWLFNLLRI